MKLLKNIILLPFLPIRLGWRWSAGAKMKTNNGQEVDSAFARLIGTVIIAGLLYSAVGFGISKVVGMFSPSTEKNQTPVVEHQESAEQSTVNQ